MNPELQLLQDETVCCAETLIWRHPPCTRPFLFDIAEAWGLWPSKEWLEDVMGALELCEEPALVLQFSYLHCRWGEHEQLRRHAASLRIPLLPQVRVLQAFGLLSTCQRRHWEAEALLVAALMAKLTRATIILKGCATEGATLWACIESGEIANAHLHQLALLAKDAVVVEKYAPDDLNSSMFEPSELASHKHFALNNEAILAWQKTYQVSLKAAAFCCDSPPFYPLASQISFTHGACLRGGLPPWGRVGPSRVVLGSLGRGEPFLSLTLESFWSLSTITHLCSRSRSRVI